MAKNETLISSIRNIIKIIPAKAYLKNSFKMKNLPKRQGVTQRGMIGPFPQNGIGGYTEMDQLVPYEGIEGIDFRSTFQRTLFRMPLRKQPSDISDSIFTTDQILKLFTDLKSTISSQFLFLRHIETIEISHILKATIPLQINSLYKATITGLTENVRNKRKCVINNKIQTFQMEIKQIEDLNDVQKDYWIIVTGAQPNPEDSQMKIFAERYRLRVLGGIAALYKSSKDDNNRLHILLNYIAAMVIALSTNTGATLLVDYTLSFRYLIRQQKLLNYENLEKESILSPFPSINRNYSKYALEYGFKHIMDIRNLLRNNWNELKFRLEPSFKSLLRSHPIWLTISRPECSITDSYNPLDEDRKKLLKPASCGYILTNSFHQHRIKTRSIFLDASNNNSCQILTVLNVPTRDIYVYTFEDVEFPKEYDSCYLDFLKDILKYIQIIQGLNWCFEPCLEESLVSFFIKYTENLSKIGFKNSIGQEIFKKFAVKGKWTQNPHLTYVIEASSWLIIYIKILNDLNLESIEGIPFIPIAKKVAWSQMPLIAEDVIPPQQVLEKYPSFGKPDVSTVVRHLRFLYSILRYDEVWKKDWTDALKTTYMRNKHPFNLENWVSADDLVLNSEFGDAKYDYPDLAMYSTMLKSAGAREIKRPNVQIKTSSLNDVTFVVNESSPTNFTFKDITFNLIRCASCYNIYILYGQNIDDAIQKLNDNYQDSKLSLYKDLLEISSDYKLDYLKELMELRLSRLVHMSNVEEMKTFAEISSANQLYEYCYQFIRDNSEL
ncbi:6235_t:CDS:10 [Funneliformis mosseae]|uniref:6235_t:CDS:1 n=1 Tax=Funneliformis mosseae TaxID=27381 RepID=A0A9N9BYB0_FUNMO|nr:6235_t:CDS:10 [Funneliformis mosseae]